MGYLFKKYCPVSTKQQQQPFTTLSCTSVVDFYTTDWFWKKESPKPPLKNYYPVYVFGHIGGWEHLHIEPNGFMGDWICNNVRLVVGGTTQWIHNFFELAFIKSYKFLLLPIHNQPLKNRNNFMIFSKV